MRFAVIRHLPLLVFVAVQPVVALQNAPSAGNSGQEIKSIVQDLADSQCAFLSSFETGLTYRSHWSTRDDDESTTIMVGSTDGLVGRLLSEGGKPLTVAASTEEHRRLVGLLEPGKVRAANGKPGRLQSYLTEIIRAMPRAMSYFRSPDQSLLTEAGRPQIVLDYKPNPAFSPNSMAERALENISGRLWIDAQTHGLLRIEIHIDSDVNIAAGLLLKVRRGGSVEYEQRHIGADRDAWTHIRLKLHVREFLLKNIDLDTDLRATDIRLLPNLLDGPQAVRSLLAEGAL